MGFFMGLARWIIGTLFVISIVFFLIASTGAHFSEKDNLKPLIQEAALSQISPEQTREISNNLENACAASGKEIIEVPATNNAISLEGVFNSSKVSINCSKLSDDYAKELFKETVVGPMFDSLYNQKCEGFCFLSDPTAALSQSANKILKKTEIITFAVVLIFAALLFLMSSGISGRLFALGKPLIFSGLPYFFTGAVQAETVKSMPPETAIAGGKIIGAILEYLSNIFLIMLIIGAVLIVAGLIIKFTLERKKGVKKK